MFIFLKVKKRKKMKKYIFIFTEQVYNIYIDFLINISSLRNFFNS